jgi:hypothetical protein
MAVDAKADNIRFHVAIANDESRHCGTDFHLLGVAIVVFRY